MIDVTFLLLVFFLCATKFKTFENKLDTYLPKDTGPSSAPPPDERLPTEVWLKHAAPEGEGVEIRFSRTRVADFDELKLRIASRHDTDEKKKNLPVNIYGTDEVHWHYVVLAFDAAIGAQVEQVQFAVGRDNKGIKLGKPR